MSRKGWKNSKEKTLKLDMQFLERYQIYVYLHTTEGKRIIAYSQSKHNLGQAGRFIRIGLGSSTIGKKWISIEQNLEKDLQKYESANHIKYVNGIKFRASGKIDNIELITNKNSSLDKKQTAISSKRSNGKNQDKEYKKDKNQNSSSKITEEKEKISYSNKKYSPSPKKSKHPISNVKNKKFKSKEAFITKWEILRQRNKKIILPIMTDDNYEYDFSIDWGDGMQDSAITESITHEYAKEGNYTVSIIGKYPKMVTPCLHRVSKYRATYHKLLSVEQWGTQKWKSMAYAFWFCQDLKEINDNKAPDLSEVKSMNSMFKYAKRFNQPLKHWDVTHVSDMNQIFLGAESFNQDISKWDISK